MTILDTADWGGGLNVGGGIVSIINLAEKFTPGTITFGPWYVGNIPALLLSTDGTAGDDWSFVWTWLNADNLGGPYVNSLTYLSNAGAESFDVVTNRGPYLSLAVTMNTGSNGFYSYTVAAVADASASNAMAPDRTLQNLNGISVNGSSTQTEVLTNQVPGPAVLWANINPNANLSLQEYKGGGVWQTFLQIGVASGGAATNFIDEIVIPNNEVRVFLTNGAVSAQGFSFSIVTQR